MSFEQKVRNFVLGAMFAFVLFWAMLAFPATAGQCYVGFAAGGAKFDNRTERVEGRLDVFPDRIKFATTEDDSSFMSEVFTGCRGSTFGLELGAIDGLKTTVTTTATVKVPIINEVYTGTFDRVVEARGVSVSGMLYHRLSPRVEAYLRLGAMYAKGEAKLKFVGLEGFFIGYEKSHWVPRVGLGLQGKNLGFEIGAFTKDDHYFLIRLKGDM